MSDTPKSFTQAFFKSKGSELCIEKTKWVTPQPNRESTLLTLKEGLLTDLLYAI